MPSRSSRILSLTIVTAVYTVIGAVIFCILERWHLEESIVFCTTVYTTIGYGHIYPQTHLDKLATVVYGMIGIPLCLIFLNEVGKYLTRHLRRSLSKISSQVTDGEDFDFTLIVSLLITFFYLLIGAFVLTFLEDWDLTDAFYFLFVSTSTIGFGDLVPTRPMMFFPFFAYMLFGLSLLSMVFNVLMEVIDERLKRQNFT